MAGPLDSLRVLFRDRAAANSGRVSSIELFFDLIFVFAVTQLSHLLLAHFTLLGAAQTLMLLLAVWWVWIDTSWATNWLNPETGPMRIVMFALMALGVIMSAVIPHAFTGATAGLVFAGTFVAMQLGRTGFVTLCMWSHGPAGFWNMVRVLLWMCLSAVAWIAGGLLPDQRLWLWGVALFIDYLAPSLMFYVPGLGTSQLTDWDIDGGHMAERCGLFIIIALGESVVVMGESFSHLPLGLVTLAAFVVDFATCIGLWWIYFGLAATKASRAITSAQVPGDLARIGYTYLHILLAAGIIVTAVGMEQVLTDALEPARLELGLTILGGPALFLGGNALFITLVARKIAPLHLSGVVVLGGLAALLAAGFGGLNVLGMGAVSAVVLGIIAIFEPLWYIRRLKARAVAVATAERTGP